MPPIIDVKNLTKRYRHHLAVDAIDLEVQEGEIFGILGPNGAGKTTTIEMIEGLRKPDSGTITVDGIDAVNDSDRVRKIIGVQLQSTALFDYLSASELIALFASFYGVTEPRNRAPELLRLVDLEDKAASRVEELSGGQQQRLSIALALVNTPRVTFLDEPTTGLDPHARRNLWQTILGVREAGATVVLTTHYMEEAEILCDRIAIMDGGKVIACDTPAGLIRGLDAGATVTATIPVGVDRACPVGADLVSARVEWVSTRDPVSSRDLASSRDLVSSHPATDGPTQGRPLLGELEQLPGVVAANIVPHETGQRLTLKTRDAQASIMALLRLASERIIVLEDLGSRRATLEDVFLARTGRAYEEDDPEPAEDEAPPPNQRGRRREKVAS